MSKHPAPREREMLARWLRERALRLVAKRQLGDFCTFSPDYIVHRFGVADLRPVCAAHDARYAQGGDERDRLEADIEFREGVRERAGWWWATIYYLGVRIGGRSSWS